jgi:hypothetical protein
MESFQLVSACNVTQTALSFLLYYKSFPQCLIWVFVLIFYKQYENNFDISYL